MAGRPLIIDTDPGKDDAVAILLALSAPEAFDLRLFSAAAGNVGLASTTANILRLRELMGCDDVPVHAGCPRALLQTLQSAAHVHGEDGLAGADLPPPRGVTEAGHATLAIVQSVRASAEPVSIACIAPLTNLALAVVMAPDIVANIAEIVVMGGSFTTGNITPHASFNIYCDPHAARIVFDCGAPVIMVGLDVTRRTMPDPAWIDRLRATRAPAASVVSDLWRQPTAYMNDACVIAHLLEPGLFRTEAARVEVEIVDPVEMGRTRRMGGNPNLRAALDIDVEGFFRLLFDRLSRDIG